jgi:hypothetical protein
MPSPYDEYREQVEKYLADNKATLEETKKQANNTIFPQHILWAKEACDELRTEEAKTLTIEGTFYFTEKLVNRLMLYAFLKGQRDIDKRSHEKGWNDYRQNIADLLGFQTEEEPIL